MVDRRLLALLCGALIILTSCAAPTPGATGSSTALPSGTTAGGTQAPADKVTLRLDYFVSPHHEPIFLAASRGYFKTEGLDLTIEEGKGSLNTLQSIAAGSDTFGYVAGSTYALGKAKGMPISMIADYVQENSAVVMSFCSAGIKKPEDLKGKTIALTPGATPGVDMLPALLGKYGMSMDDLKVVNTDPGAQIPAFLGGKVDVITGFGFSSLGNTQIQAAKAGKGDICSMAISDYGINMMGFGIVVNLATLDKNPDVARRFLIAMNKGWQDFLKDPAAGVEATAAAYPKTDKEFLQKGADVLPTLIHTAASKDKPLGWMALADWEQTLQLAQQYDGLQSSLQPADYFSNEYLPAE